jgi:hypothetical protein
MRTEILNRVYTTDQITILISTKVSHLVFNRLYPKIFSVGKKKFDEDGIK